MDTKEKILDDLVFIIEELLEHLESKNEISLLSEKNVEVITEKLYNLYSFDYRFKEIVVDVVDCTIHPTKKARVKNELAIYKKSLVKAENLCLEAIRRGILNKIEKINGWDYIYISDFEKYKKYVGSRIYLNCTAEAIPDLMLQIIRKIKEQLEINLSCSFCGLQARPYEIICNNCKKFLPRVYPLSIKFIDPQSLNENQLAEILRPDKIVLYIYPWPNLVQELTKWFTPLLKRGFYEDVPLFAKKIANGIGYAPEPTSKQKNLYESDGGTSKSFGSILSFLIAKVVCRWVDDKREIPKKEDIMSIAEWTYEKIFKDRYKLEFDLGIK